MYKLPLKHYFKNIHITFPTTLKTQGKSTKTKKIYVTFCDLCVHFEVIRGKDIVQPPGESPLLLLNPSLIKKHVFGSEWHWMSRNSFRREGGKNKNTFNEQ